MKSESVAIEQDRNRDLSMPTNREMQDSNSQDGPQLQLRFPGSTEENIKERWIPNRNGNWHDEKTVIVRSLSTPDISDRSWPTQSTVQARASN